MRIASPHVDWSLFLIAVKIQAIQAFQASKRWICSLLAFCKSPVPGKLRPGFFGICRALTNRERLDADAWRTESRVREVCCRWEKVSHARH